MPAGGVVGRRIRSAYAVTSTWGVPASVTQQIMYESNDGFDNQPELVNDESFSQDFIGLGEMGDNQALTPSLAMQFRFEQGADVFLAAALGSPGNPTVISSQAAASLVAYQHVIDMSPELHGMFTMATNMQRYIQEVVSFKVNGFSLSVGDQGRFNISYNIVGGKTDYASTVNTSATVAGATIATPGSRAFRRLTTLRINPMAGGSLTAADAVPNATEFSVDYTRPLAQDQVLGLDYIIEADDDGFFEGTMRVLFSRMTSAAANSMMVAYSTGNALKADVTMLGTFINSTTRRSALWQFPALQVETGGYKAVVVGHGQVRPEVTFRLKAAPSAPTGMAGITNPLRVTIVNTRSTNLAV